MKEEIIKIKYDVLHTKIITPLEAHSVVKSFIFFLYGIFNTLKLYYSIL